MQLFLITGTSKGIGQALKNIVLAEGHVVIGISRSRLKSQGKDQHICFDLSQSQHIESKLLPKIKLRLKKIKLSEITSVHLVNNAAQLEPVGPVQEIHFKQAEQALKTNFLTPIMLTKVFLKLFERKLGSASVTNLSSGVAFSPLAGWALYSASKAALKSYSHSLRLELPPSVRVRSLSPGLVDTPMQEQIRKKSLKKFALAGQFVDYKKNKQLRAPADVAQALFDLTQSENPELPVEVKV